MDAGQLLKKQASDAGVFLPTKQLTSEQSQEIKIIVAFFVWIIWKLSSRFLFLFSSKMTQFTLKFSFFFEFKKLEKRFTEGKQKFDMNGQSFIILLLTARIKQSPKPERASLQKLPL